MGFDNEPLFLLEHKHKDSAGEHFKLIGLFSAEKIALDVIAYLITKPGFKRFPNSFSIQKVYADSPSWLGGFPLAHPEQRLTKDKQILKGETAEQFIERLMAQKYGEDWVQRGRGIGPGTEFDAIRKWGDRGFE